MSNLGKITDDALAQLIGVSRETVRRQRASLGIPAKKDERRLEAKLLDLLGTKPDSELARDLGYTINHVQRTRFRLGIPSVGRRGRKRLQWSPNRIAMLGTVPDKTIAAAMAIGESTVRRKREELGIPSSMARR